MVMIRRCAWAAALLAVCAASGAGAAPPLQLPPAVEAHVRAGEPARVLVELAEPSAGSTSPAARAALSRIRDRVLATLPAADRAEARLYDRMPFLAGRFGPAALRQLAQQADVVAIHEDRPWAPLLSETIPQIGADVAHAAGIDGSGSVVAVLDTGVDAGHPMLQGALVGEACFSNGRDCPNGQRSQVGSGAAIFCSYATGCFHGTHVAGIAVGRPASGRVGVAPGAGLLAVQVFTEGRGIDCAGQGEDPCAVAWTSDIVAGMDHVLSLAGTLDVAAVNLSLGGGSWNSEQSCDAQNGAFKTAAAQLAAAGIPTVAAAGNEGNTDALSAPACVSNVVSVGAVTETDHIWSGSNDAAFLDLLSPGRNVISAAPAALLGKSWVSATGTSMATPGVSGAFALLRQAAPGIAYTAALDLLIDTGLPVLDGRSGRIHPRIDLAAASALLTGPECSNQLDDDGDGDVDYPADPGCVGASGREGPACDDDLDNDGDGDVDWDGGSGGAAPDPNCSGPIDGREAPNACGLGFELAPLLAGLGVALRRRRGRRA